MISLESEKFSETVNKTYGDFAPLQKERFTELSEMFISTFSYSPSDFFSSPGRIEIVGNHTDHNSGKVLCAAINFDTLACVCPSEDGIIEIKSSGYPLLKVDTTKIDFLSSELGTSTALIKGVVDYFLRSGKKVGGFKATMTSTVPKGAGVSSSSSFECMVAEILSCYYNSDNVDPVFKAKASQYAEKAYFGKPCGLMDQCAIALGGVNHIDFEDQENPEVRKVEWLFDDLDVFVISTGGDHANLTDEYAAIPREMKEVASFFGVNLLREIDSSLWISSKESVKNSVSNRAYLRAEHFFEENERVDTAYGAIKNADEELFLKAVNESGLSSRFKLQNTYSPKSKNHGIENALDKVHGLKGVKAERVHGGGFAGTILVFADRAEKELKSELEQLFGKENVFGLSIRESGAERLILE
ncbi:MAG: galactokinase [Clostridia bacterium]|nr:galactokinase [Clostridia bacterium]